MHELKICESLVDAILAQMEKLDTPAARLLRVRVVVGALRQVVPEYLQEGYALLVAGTRAEGSVMEIETAAIQGECEACGWKGNLGDGAFVCGACGATRARVVGGTELYLKDMDIETGEEGTT